MGSPPCKVAGIVVAAGRARRLGRGEGKALLTVRGLPLVAYTVGALERSEWVERTVVAVRADEREVFQRLAEQQGWLKCREGVVAGGAERFHSVRNALAALDSSPPDVVLIHDAARPLLTEAMIGAAASAAWQHGAAVVAVPAVDTVKRSHADGFVHETIPRNGLWQVQTPQAFRYSVIWSAYQNVDEAVALSVTDDAELVERHGHAVAIVAGSRYNVKVTFPEDLPVVEALLAAREREAAANEC